MIATPLTIHAFRGAPRLLSALVSLCIVAISATAYARPATVVVFEAKVRTSPQDDAKVVELMVEGTSVSVDEVSTDGWRRVRLSNSKRTGWIRDVDIGLADAPPNAARLRIALPATNLRDGPSMGAKVIQALVAGEVVTQRGPRLESFIPVTTAAGVEGFVTYDAVEAASEPVVPVVAAAPRPAALVVSAPEAAVFDEESRFGREKTQVHAGDKLTQLASPRQGFVHVRTGSGIAGYVELAAVQGVRATVSTSPPPPVSNVVAPPTPNPTPEPARRPAPVSVMNALKFSKGSGLVSYALSGPVVPSNARSLRTRATTATGLNIGAVAVMILGSLPLLGAAGSEGGISDTDTGIAVGGLILGGIAVLVGLAIRPGHDDYYGLAHAYTALNPRRPVAYEPPTEIHIYVAPGTYR